MNLDGKRWQEGNFWGIRLSRACHLNESKLSLLRVFPDFKICLHKDFLKSWRNTAAVTYGLRFSGDVEACSGCLCKKVLKKYLFLCFKVLLRFTSTVKELNSKTEKSSEKTNWTEKLSGWDLFHSSEKYPDIPNKRAMKGACVWLETLPVTPSSEEGTPFCWFVLRVVRWSRCQVRPLESAWGGSTKGREKPDERPGWWSAASLSCCFCWTAGSEQAQAGCRAVASSQPRVKLWRWRPPHWEEWSLVCQRGTSLESPRSGPSSQAHPWCSECTMRGWKHRGVKKKKSGSFLEGQTNAFKILQCDQNM